MDYDVFIIGSGPGGEGAAMQAAKGGKRVGIVEAMSQLGGGSTHKGTIPSKSLKYSIHLLAQVKNQFHFSPNHEIHTVNYPDLLQNAASVIEKQVKMRESFYERNGIKIFFGRAEFIDEHRLRIRQYDGMEEEVTAESIVIATGSRPYHPPNVDFSHPLVHDSDSILSLDKKPKSVTVYGAGVIGSEYASIFRDLGIKVNLINTRHRLLEFLDDEITDALSYHLRDQGVLLRHDEIYEAVEPAADGVILHLKSGKKIKTEILLWANGRSGNTQNMGLEEIGVVPNYRGQLEVNDKYQTNLPHIYAVGDVTGYPSLASAAYDQGRFVSKHIVYGEDNQELLGEFPTGIYTNPEISSVGKTERELTAEHVPYEVGHAYFRNLARAQITGVTAGVLKIIFHRETYQILGIHCFGYQAAEIVHIGQAIMSQDGEANTIKYFVDTTFNYPTMAEAYRVAALNGLNRVF